MQIEFTRMLMNMDPMLGGGMYPGMGADSMAAARCGNCGGGGPMSPMGGLGGFGPMGGMGGLGNTQFLMQMVQFLSVMLLGNMMRQAAMGGAGGGGGTSPLDSMGGAGGSSGTGGTAGTGGTDASGASAGASGSNAVDLGRRFLGQNSIDIKGKLPKFTAAGGQTNNCADFVSSLLENAGTLKGHFVNVKGLENALKQQGWRQIPAAQAKPGDVWMNHSRGHVELVTQAGGTKTIGSNNDRPGHQVISERAKSPSSGIYYTRG